MFLNRGKPYYVPTPNVPKSLMCPVAWMKYRNRLVEACIDLVKWQVNRSFERWLKQAPDYHNRFDDLTSEGNAALVKAASFYDWGRGCQFSTYAADVIWKELVRYITTKGRYVHTVSIGCEDNFPHVDTEEEMVDRENVRITYSRKLEELKMWLPTTQLQILELILTKATHMQIAKRIGKSPTTVRNYIVLIKEKARELVA